VQVPGGRGDPRERPMPRLKPDTQRRRREHILDAAERCFTRSGFHRTTMQDICKEAGVSAGALYLYFDSKESLIAGIAERNRSEFQERFAALAGASDFLAALAELCQRYFVEEPAHKRLMCIEIGLEATRNETVGEIYRGVDRMVRDSFEALFQRLKDEGRIRPAVEGELLVSVFMTIGDGLFWRRAVDPAFDPATTLPAVMSVIGALLNPVPDGAAGATAPGRLPSEAST
jgi:TetR/AcrR family transcriptional regulator, repressor for uid operon